MRRQPVARSFRRKPVQEARFSRTARPEELPSPVGGWNARDAIDSMAKTDAIRLENWFPTQSNCVIRPGTSQFCDTGNAGKTIHTMMSYEYGAVSKMLAAVNGKIVDVSTATPSNLATGLANDYYVNEMFGGKLFMANGADTMKQFDGTSISNSTFTGVTLSNIIYVMGYKSRIFCVEKNTQKVWYGGVGSVSGALTAFDFSTVASIRGNLMMTARLKGDGGDGGNDDIFLAIFESGDVLAYTGSNPGDANNWSMIGRYKIGRPLSRFGIYNGDDDVYIITARGYEKLTEIVKYGESAPERLVMSNKIQGEVISDITFLNASNDWCMSVFPGGQMLIITVPRTSTSRRYHVRNINTKAWCKFKDFYAYSWTMFGTKCYFGSDDGKVYEFSFSYSTDNGSPIYADGQQAWNSLGYPGYVKAIKLCRATIASPSKPAVSVTVGSDYTDPAIVAYDSAGSAGGAAWDSAVWDSAVWGGAESIWRSWVSRNVEGHIVSLRLRAVCAGDSIKWNGSTILFSVGGPI